MLEITEGKFEIADQKQSLDIYRLHPLPENMWHVCTAPDMNTSRHQPFF